MAQRKKKAGKKAEGKKNDLKDYRHDDARRKNNREAWFAYRDLRQKGQFKPECGDDLPLDPSIDELRRQGTGREAVAVKAGMALPAFIRAKT